MKKEFNLIKKKSDWKSIFLTATLIGGLSIMTSCQDDLKGEENGNKEPEMAQEGMVVSNNPADFEGRVTLFKGNNGLARANNNENIPALNMQMPAQPECPADAIDMKSEGFNPVSTTDGTGKSFVLKAGEELTLDVLQVRDAEWFVYGNLTIKESKGKGKIYLMPGSTLDRNMGQDINGLCIYNYGGTFESATREKLAIYPGYCYMTVGDLEMDEIQVAGELYVGGKLTAKSLESTNGTVRIEDGASVENKVHTNSQATMYVGGKFTAGEILAESASVILTDCWTEASSLEIKTSATVDVANYLLAGNTALMGSSQLFTHSGGYLSLGNWTLTAQGGVPKIEVIGEDYAIVEAQTITLPHPDLRTVLKGYMGLHYNEIKGVDETKLELLSEIKVNDDDKTYIQSSECNPGYGVNGGSGDGDGGDKNPDEGNRIVIEHIAEVSSPDHEHDISATCVQPVGNNKAYVSYHQQGNEYSGCIEVFNLNSDTDFSLVSYMRSVEKRDFNHLLVDGNMIYAAGGERKGGFIASANLDYDGKFSTDDADGLTIVRLQGGDGNCLIKANNEFIVASNWGFEGFQSGWVKGAEKATAGSGKHIYTDGSKYVTLNLTSRGETESGAEVSVYNITEPINGNPQKTFTVDNITPINGKNVCKLDGDNVYVCLGNNGFKRYSVSSGTETGAFKIDNTKAAVNGMDFDDQYIYIAYGSKGLYVLDKNTLEVVAKYVKTGLKSANYIKAHNGYIYVAFGRDGLQLFKLNIK